MFVFQFPADLQLTTRLGAENDFVQFAFKGAIKTSGVINSFPSRTGEVFISWIPFFVARYARRFNINTYVFCIGSESGTAEWRQAKTWERQGQSIQQFTTTPKPTPPACASSENSRTRLSYW
jgi:hypothetical protein